MAKFKIGIDLATIDGGFKVPGEKTKKTKFRDSSPHIKDKRAPKKNNNFKRTKI